jgi:hypothetical protein
VGKTFGKLSKFKTITTLVDNFQDLLHERDLLNTMKDDRTTVKPAAVSSVEGERASSRNNMTTEENMLL